MQNKIINKLLFSEIPLSNKAAYRKALQAAFAAVQKRQQENAGRLPDICQMKERLKECRAQSIENEELWNQALTNLKANGFKVHVVEEEEAIIPLLLQEIGSEKLIVKAKSNISKELHIADHLESFGIKVVETDIGDRIIQIAQDRPSHPTNSASHLNREEIADLLLLKMEIHVPPEPEAIVNALKENIKEAIAGAKIGISGANAISAAEGAVVIIHNEGNVSEISRLPGKHIIIADSNKIYPSLEDALNMLKLQTYCATGELTTSYINIISGVSKAAAIDKKLFYGIHGPAEIVLILFKRKKLPQEFKESAYCIGCGNCLLECPVYLEKGSRFGAYYKQGGIGVVQSALNTGLKEGIDNGLYSCAGCGTCRLNCPAGIDVPGLIKSIREQAAIQQEKLTAPYRRLAKMVVTAAGMGGALKQITCKSKGNLAYFPGCLGTLNTPEVRTDAIKLLGELTGELPRIIDGCCGGIWDNLGFKNEYQEAFEKFLQNLGPDVPPQIVVSCPHCYELLWLKNKERLLAAGVKQVLRLTEMLDTLLPEHKKDEGGAPLKVTFHDSCLFGRKMGFYDDPRRLLRKLDATELVEMDKNLEHTRCCGFSLSVSDPDAARRIAQKIANAAAASGANMLVTSECPGCYYALKDSKNIKVENIASFIYQRVKKL